MSLDGRRILTSSCGGLRSAARILLEHGIAPGIAAFRVADTHVHSLLPCARAAAGKFVHRVECALHWRLGLGAPFEPAHYEPVHTQAHLTHAFWYILRQEQHHGTALDPMHEGSSLFDTIGLRAVDPGLRCRVAGLLPRVRRAALAELIAPNALALIDGIEPTPLALDRLADAAAAAFALPDLGPGRSPARVLARRCAVDVAQANAHRWATAHGESRSRALANALGLSQRTGQLLLAAVVRSERDEGASGRALVRQWQLRSGLADDPVGR